MVYRLNVNNSYKFSRCFQYGKLGMANGGIEKKCFINRDFVYLFLSNRIAVLLNKSKW